MARRKPKNPIQDLGGQVGEWVGGGVKALGTFLQGDKNPTMNPQTRNVVRATQTVADVVTGGAVEAMKGGPDAVQRYAAQQAAIYAAGLAAGPAISAAGKGLKGIKQIPSVAKRLPVSAKTVSEMKRAHIEQVIQIAERGQARYVSQQRKTAQMANQFMQQYQQYNPVYQRAEAMHIEDVAQQLQQANAPAMEIDIDPKKVHRNLAKSANEIFRETVQRGAKAGPEQYPGWQDDIAGQLKRDIEEAKAYQRARGVLHRIGIENTRRLPADTVEKRLAKEFRDEELRDRLEVQILRSMMRRGGKL